MTVRTVKVIAGVLDPLKSVVHGNGLRSGIAGKHRYLTITSRDRFGNDRKIEADKGQKDDEFTLRVNAGAWSQQYIYKACPTYAKNYTGPCVGFVKGTRNLYDVNYTIYTSGLYSFQVSYHATPLTDTIPFKIDPAPTSPKDSTASGRGTMLATQHAVTTYTVEARDRYGNMRESGGDKVASTVFGVETVQAKVTDHKNGTYTCAYKLLTLGVYTMTISMDGVRIIGNPFSIQNLDPNRNNPISSAANTFAFGGGLDGAKVGTTMRFTVQMMDVNNRNQIRGGANMTMTLVGSAGKIIAYTPTMRKCANKKTGPCIDDTNIGRYIVTYIVKRSGTYTFFMALDTEEGWKNMTGIGTKKLVFTPGDMYAPTCTAEGALQAVTAGKTNTILVQGRDANSNLRMDVKDANFFKVGLDGPIKVKGRAAKLLKNGKYSVEYVATVRGEYKLSVTYRDKDIRASPFKLKVAPALLSPRHSDATGSALKTARVGDTNNVAIQCRDRFSNNLLSCKASVSIKLTQGVISLFGKSKSGVAGTYDGSYKAVAVGTYKIAITIDKLSIVGSPFTAKLTPGSPDSKNSFAKGKALTSILAGDVGKVDVTTVDAFNNKCIESSKNLVRPHSPNSASWYHTFAAARTPNATDRTRIALSPAVRARKEQPVSHTRRRGGCTLPTTMRVRRW